MEETDPIKELNRLWEPVRPYLARQVSELYGRRDGSVLEVGPFSGLALELASEGIGASFHLAVFPGEVAEALKAEAREMGLADRVTISESNDKLSGVHAEAFDLVIFRGAFFFPAFFEPDLPAIYGALKPGGLAFLGGGFGRYTPEAVIRGLELRSKELNQALGRVRITEKDLRSLLSAAELEERGEVITAGGLWVVLRKILPA